MNVILKLFSTQFPRNYVHIQLNCFLNYVALTTVIAARIMLGYVFSSSGHVTVLSESEWMMGKAYKEQDWTPLTSHPSTPILWGKQRKLSMNVYSVWTF